MARQNNNSKQRTLIVLGTLLAAMTAGAGVLLVLEPPALAPGESIRLMYLDGQGEARTPLFDTSAPLGWTGIVIYDSGSVEGSAQAIHAVHQRMGLGGLGYHFVVDNGQGGADGNIEIGYRWKQQVLSPWSGAQVIGICLVGDTDRDSPTGMQMDRLGWLVQKLQSRFNIPAERVYIQTGGGKNGARNLFPAASFRQQLLAQP